MDLRALFHFEQELRFQCDVALHAYEEFDRSFAQPDASFGVRVFRNVQVILTAAAAISRILFPTRGDAKRGRLLRERLEIPEDTILRSRDMRNHFEHFDERLDEWLPRAVHGSIIDMVSRGNTGAPRYVLRMFNVSTFEVTFADETLALRPLIGAVAELKARLREHSWA